MHLRSARACRLCARQHSRTSVRGVPCYPDNIRAVCPLTRIVRAHSSSSEEAGAADSSGAGDNTELPEALQGLSINDQGLLVDEKSGKVVNSLGATRWDVAVSAMRGLLDPPAWVENTENTPGLILASLKQFPCKHCFSIVGRNEPGFRGDVLALIERVCQSEVHPNDVKEVERLGGKYISLQVDVMIRAPEVIGMVIDELGQDSRVKMKY